jgi:hypothetical protein
MTDQFWKSGLNCTHIHLGAQNWRSSFLPPQSFSNHLRTNGNDHIIQIWNNRVENRYSNERSQEACGEDRPHMLVQPYWLAWRNSLCSFAVYRIDLTVTINALFIHLLIFTLFPPILSVSITPILWIHWLILYSFIHSLLFHLSTHTHIHPTVFYEHLLCARHSSNKYLPTLFTCIPFNPRYHWLDTKETPVLTEFIKLPSVLVEVQKERYYTG